ncbi:MAG TPA: DUF6221 family protein [Thermobifida alba]|nr:DUF6221 family protein [Thermobifida alba]
MSELVEFLRERLIEDEQTLHDAGGLLCQWDTRPGPDAPEEEAEVWASGRFLLVPAMPVDQARHIARHDPARVRREVEAKRDLLMRYERHLAEKKDLQAALDEAEQAVEHEERTGEWTKPAGWLRNLNREGERLETRGSVLRALMRAAAAVYQDHPDYEDSWRIQ